VWHEHAEALERLARQGRRRAWPPRSAAGADFASNDYLGFARRPELVAAAHAALDRFGVGSRAARQLGGANEALLAAEEAAAEWLGAEAALLFPSGYQANLGLLGALCGRGDVLVSDELNHASLVDGARLSRAEVVVARHLDLEDYEVALSRARGARRRLVVVESVFSMDGDLAPLVELSHLCARHAAWLVVDEAHAVGLLGPRGAGAWPLALAAGADGSRLAARVATGSKSLGVGGAFVAGPRATVEWVANRARAFLFTTAPPPVVGAALARAIDLVACADAERETALGHARHLAEALGVARPAAAIVPFVLGGDERAVGVATRLVERGFDARAVRPPTVPEGSARLRLVTHAHNTADEVAGLAAALAGERASTSVRDPGARDVGAPYVGAPYVGARGATRRDVLVVVGTDTDVGKTVASAALLLAAPAHWRYWKPVQTGSDSDTARVRELTELPAARFATPLAHYALPASPHTAAANEGTRVPVDDLDGALAAEAARGGVLVELAGGLLVPYDDERTQADWLARLGARTVLVARSGLGTLNHTLLTMEALARRHVAVAALVLVGEPHAANRATLAGRLAPLPVFELPRFAALERAALAHWAATSGVRTVLFGAGAGENAP
jgi:8-amino-7-oxononanoate synthase/dethiobiotin synthase